MGWTSSAAGRSGSATGSGGAGVASAGFLAGVFAGVAAFLGVALVADFFADALAGVADLAGVFLAPFSALPVFFSAFLSVVFLSLALFLAVVSVFALSFAVRFYPASSAPLAFSFDADLVGFFVFSST